jgi:hypothetical protein
LTNLTAAGIGVVILQHWGTCISLLQICKKIK